MLQNTKGIVLRSIRYGETSLISAVFTEHFGVQSYLVQGVRSARSKTNKASLLQPATLLDLSVYQKPGKNLQRLREFNRSYIYTSLQQEVVKNSVALFSVELLLRLLPEHAPLLEFYAFSEDYFKRLDQWPPHAVANFPLYFIIHCTRFLGFDLKGEHSVETPFLHLQEGGFSEQSPQSKPFVQEEDVASLTQLLAVKNYEALNDVELNAAARMRLLEWFLEFLYQHAQHLGQIKSLAVLQAVLH